MAMSQHNEPVSSDDDDDRVIDWDKLKGKVEIKNDKPLTAFGLMQCQPRYTASTATIMQNLIDHNLTLLHAYQELIKATSEVPETAQPNASSKAPEIPITNPSLIELKEMIPQTRGEHYMKLLTQICTNMALRKQFEDKVKEFIDRGFFYVKSRRRKTLQEEKESIPIALQDARF